MPPRLNLILAIFGSFFRLTPSSPVALMHPQISAISFLSARLAGLGPVSICRLLIQIPTLVGLTLDRSIVIQVPVVTHRRTKAHLVSLFGLRHKRLGCDSSHRCISNFGGCHCSPPFCSCVSKFTCILSLLRDQSTSTIHYLPFPLDFYSGVEEENRGVGVDIMRLSQQKK